MSDAPFFILGSHGSGSTLLRLMLDSHPRLAVPPETGFLRLVTMHRWVPYWELGGGWHDRLGVPADDLDRRLGDLYGGMFRDYAAARGKARWGEKTPFHVWHVAEAQRLFPDAVFVGIVRHPLSAVASMHRRFDRRTQRAVRHWVSSVAELSLRAGDLGDRLRVVRYEDLTRHPEAVMRELLGWLGEEWSDQVVQHHEVQRERAPKVVEGGTRTTEAVDPGRIERWRKWMSEEERDSVLATTRAWAGVFGYRADPGTTDDLAGGYLLTGGEISRRFAALPEEDRTPPKRPPYDDPLLPRGRRRRRRALRRQESRGRRAARNLLEQLPPDVQRAARGARRKRRRRTDD